MVDLIPPELPRDHPQRVNTGQRTLEASVSERTLHDELEDVVPGVDNGKFSRWRMRH